MGKKMPNTIIDLDGVSVFPKWYVIVTKYNYETKLARNIIDGVVNAKLNDRIFEILVPIKETTESRVNAKGTVIERKKHEKIYPLYIFINAKMDNEVWNYIKNSEGSSTILAPGGLPMVMSEEDILKIKEQCGLIEYENEYFEPQIGQDIYVLDGPFKGQCGKITKIQNKAITVDINGKIIKMDISILEHVQFVD